MLKEMDYVIFGAGIFGMYAAKILGEMGRRVALIEIDAQPLQRASYINQARVHNGYHYPRSVSTAEKSASYYDRFNREFGFAVHKEFQKIYAISAHDSFTNADQFERFCKYVNIPAEEINPGKYFNEGMVEAAFITNEYTYDAAKIRAFMGEQLSQLKNVDIIYSSYIVNAAAEGDRYVIHLNNGIVISTPNALNATYASINQLLTVFGLELFKTKYELCEVILTRISGEFHNTGITVMDGPFFSMMPFGLSGFHSLTSVSDTPHETFQGDYPVFSCQAYREDCNANILQNCNSCIYQPQSAWPRMKQLAGKYLKPEIGISYQSSLFAVKTILSSAEIDDSRPTVIKMASDTPRFISIFSGKFNTIYDLEEVLR
jgi:glycine/D-amino acid oxidase-like deaminating enzyme